ncbi:DEAD/DEAH box helicase [Fibrobacter sp.]
MPIFKNIVNKILQKTPLTITSAANVRNVALRRCMLEELAKKNYSDEGVLAKPFYEAIFPWEGDACTLKQRCDKKEINPIIADLHCKKLDDGKEIDSLYRHQRRAIEAVRDGKSIVVTTGTGSGKTECFMYPIFDYLAEKNDSGKELKGVQALFLYPLNALIQSQGDRFERFCKKFNEKNPANRVHYANYTGKMEETYSEAIKKLQEQNPNLSEEQLKKKFPEDGVEYIDRTTLRRSVPQFLITNSTMLEYALIRKSDAPLFENSDLKFVVLDEAHSYTGSNATELAMRLRRVLLAFGKKPSEVQFIMTSATVGQENDIKQFLADITDVDVKNVECINGKRIVPELKPVSGQKYNVENALRMLKASFDDATRFEILCRTDKALQLRQRFISGSGRLSQDSLNDFLRLKSSDTVDFLDFASSTKNTDGQYFLPLKMHVFQKHFPGVWACCNPDCSGKQPSLQGGSSDWKYGRVYFDINDVDKAVDENNNPVGLKTCAFCNHNILQVVSCRFCGEVYLAGQAEWDDENNRKNLIVRIPKVVDEITPEEDDDDDFSSNSSNRNGSGKVMPVLLHWIPDDSKNYRKEWLEYIKSVDVQVHLCSGTEKINSLGLITFLECQSNIGRCHNCSMPFHIPNIMNANGSFPIGNNTNISNFGASSKILYSSLVKDVLLEDTEVSKDLPTGGRKLLGFTDSRQGTAYYAGMQGIVAEMAATRVWILNYLFENATYVREDLIDKIEQGIEKIGLERFHLPDDIKDKEARSLAKLFIWREITFRNRRKRSLETLGLMQVQYKKLNEISRPDDNLSQFFASDQDYQDLLKIVLDYGFRKTGALTLDGWDDPREIRQAYAGTAVFIKPFDLSYYNPQQRPDRLNGVANILRYYVEDEVTDRKTGDEWQLVCQLARKVIKDLTDKGIIKKVKSAEDKKNADEYKIKWEQVILALPPKIWVCPSTKTLLDVVIYKLHANGDGEYFSPYVVSVADWGRRLPLLPESAEDLTDVWKSNDKRNAFIDKFKDRSWWTDLHQDVLSSCNDNDAFVVSQEDTAQISSIQRAMDQEDFKQGKINILNCSTTMEMGVDIGEVSLVSMTNVPPHEYNYVQRAGRAGRAGQGQSFIWTMSSFGGHERKAVKDPLQWVERCTLKQKLNLENQTIVQRHFNSYLLAKWIRSQEQFKTDFEKKIFEFFIGEIDNTEWVLLLSFLLRDGSKAKVMSPVEFRTNLETAMAQSPMNAFIDAMPTIAVDDALLAKTNCTKDELMQSACEKWKEVYRSWENNVVSYYESIIDGLQIDSYINYSDIPMKNRAVLRHLKKELMDYGLGYLIKKGILPSNGMPIDVVSLELPSDNPYSNGQDSANSKKEFPSRERKIAIREFSPGYSLIVDGQRLVSRGISLRPCPKSMSGDTLIRSYYTCQRCGMPYISGIDGVSNSNEIRCSGCQDIIHGTPRKIVEPIGFKVLESDRNLDSVSKAPFEMPHIKLLSGFKSAAFNDCFSINYGSAMVVYLNGNTMASNTNSAVNQEPGPRRKGNPPADSADDAYCLCLNCGFTALSRNAMEKDSKKEPGESSCVHETFAKKYGTRGCKPEHYRMVSLAAMNRTDATFIHIKQLNDPVSANTWALALRNALTSHLALDESEIGWTSQKGTDGVYDIVLYDNAAGGANLCTKIKDNILTIFKKAKSLLECPSECDSICLDCLLTRETQVLAHVLNRIVALKKLDDAFFAGLEIPENRKYWGDETQFFPDFFKISQETINNNSDYDAIQFFLTGEETVSLMSDWPLKYSINQNRDKIRFVVPCDIWERAKKDPYLKALMMHVYQMTGQLYTAEKMPVAKSASGESARVFMEKILHDEACDYVVENLGETDGLPIFDTLWQAPQKLSTFYGNASVTPVQSRDLPELFDNGLNAKCKLIQTSNEYRIERIAESIFGDFQSDELFPSKKVDKLEFFDRYLFTPSAIRVVCELIKYFDPENVSVISTRGKNDSKLKARDKTNAWACDYIDRHLDILEKALCAIMPNAKVTVDAQKAPHDRSMLLTYEDGSTRLIQFTGSPTIWEMKPSDGKTPATIHAGYSDIDPQREADVILSVESCPVKLTEATSVIVSK